VILPETTRVAEGLTVVGASPDMLRELLEAYDWECTRAGASFADAYAKGLSASEIEDRFAAIGIVPPAELIVWWSWYDGLIPGNQPGPFWEQISLDTAIAIYKGQDVGLFEDQWNPDWIRVAGWGANVGVAVSCATSDIPPLVRQVAPGERSTQPTDDEDQVVSLCTPVAWWCLGLAKGFSVWDAEKGQFRTDIREYPREWRHTGLL